MPKGVFGRRTSMSPPPDGWAQSRDLSSVSSTAISSLSTASGCGSSMGVIPAYVKSVRASVKALVVQRWLTAADGESIVHEAERADVPPSTLAVSRPLTAAPYPQCQDRYPVTGHSWPWIAASHAARPIDLAQVGYIEEEYVIKGRARVLDWPSIDHLSSLAEGPYVTRIIVRRPADPKHFSGTVWVEPLNPSMRYDLPLVWGDTYDYSRESRRHLGGRYGQTRSDPVSAGV